MPDKNKIAGLPSASIFNSPVPNPAPEINLHYIDPAQFEVGQPILNDQLASQKAAKATEVKQNFNSAQQQIQDQAIAQQEAVASLKRVYPHDNFSAGEIRSEMNRILAAQAARKNAVVVKHTESIPDNQFKQAIGYKDQKIRLSQATERTLGDVINAANPAAPQLFKGSFNDKFLDSPEFKQAVIAKALDGDDPSGAAALNAPTLRKAAQEIIDARLYDHNTTPAVFGQAVNKFHETLRGIPYAGKVLDAIAQVPQEGLRSLATIGAAGASIVDATLFDINTPWDKRDISFGEAFKNKRRAIDRVFPSSRPKDANTLDELAQITGEFIAPGAAEIPFLGALGSSRLATRGLSAAEGAAKTADRLLVYTPAGKAAAAVLKGVENLEGSRAVQFLDNTMGFMKAAGPQVYSGYYDQLIEKGFTPEQASNKAFSRTFINALAMGGPRNFLSVARKGGTVEGILNGADAEAASTWLNKGLSFAKNYGKAAATNAAYAAGEGALSSLADSYQNFSDDKLLGRLPEDAQFDWSGALQDAQKTGANFALFGAIMGTVNKHGVTPNNVHSNHMASALEGRQAFDAQLAEQVQSGKLNPEAADRISSFLTTIAPDYEVAKQIQVPRSKLGFKYTEPLSPDQAVKYAVESARLKDAKLKLQTETDPTKISDLTTKAAASERTIQQLKSGAYIKGRTLTAQEMQDIAEANSPKGVTPEQTKNIKENGPYNSKTVPLSDFAADPQIQAQVRILQNKEIVDAHLAERQPLEKERAEIQDRYAQKKAEDGTVLVEATSPSVEDEGQRGKDAKRLAEINRQLSDMGSRAPALAEAEQISGFTSQGEVPPVVGVGGEIIDGKKRIAKAIADGQTEIEVAAPVSKVTIDEGIADEHDSLLGDGAPVTAGLTKHMADHVTAASGAMAEHTDPVKAYEAATDELIKRGAKKENIPELLARAGGNTISEAQAEAIVNGVAKGERVPVRAVPEPESKLPIEDRPGADATEVLQEINPENKPIEFEAPAAATWLRNRAAEIREASKGTLMSAGPVNPRTAATFLELMADAIEGGATLTRAIKRSLTSMRREYKKNGAQDELDEAALEKLARRTFFEGSENAKRDIREATTSVKDKVVEVKEYASLKEQIKLEAKAAKEAQSAERKTQQDFGKTISTYIYDNLNRGELTNAQANALISRSAKVGTSERRLADFIAFADKVIDKVNYKESLSEAKGLQSKIRAANKSKAFERSANNTDAVKQFLRINPSMVESVEEYNDIAAKVLTSTKPISAHIKDGAAQISNADYEIDNQQKAEYVTKQNEYAEKVKKEQLAEQYNALVADGTLDPNTMSLPEMQQIMDAINKPEAEADATLAAAEGAEKIRAVKEVIDYQKIGLQEFKDNFADATEEEQSVIGNVLGIDTDQLTMKQLVKLNDVINNIVVNENFTGTGDIAALAEIQKAIPEIKAKMEAAGSTPAEFGKLAHTLTSGFASINMMHDLIAKDSKIAAEVQRLSGISELFDGHARAKVLQDNTMQMYDELKESMPDEVSDPENVYQRGVYATIVQHFGDTAEANQGEFDRLKGLIRKSADRMLKSTDKEVSAEGKVLDAVYKEILESSVTPDDVKSKLSEDNLKIVEFFQNSFQQRESVTAENSEIYSNKPFEKVENYTPIKWKAVDGGEVSKTDDRDMFAANWLSKKVDQTPAGTKERRRVYFDLPTPNSVLDLNFDAVMSEKFYETNYDVETSKAKAKLRAFFDNPGSEEVYGNVKNKSLVQETVKNAALQQAGKLNASSDMERGINKAIAVASLKSARIALGSVSQMASQYPSVAVSTIANVGPTLYLKALKYSNPLKTTGKLKLFERFNIGQRGGTQGGYNRDLDFNTIDRTVIGNKVKKNLDLIDKTGAKVHDAIMSTLTKSDVSVARTSWLSYYMQDLMRQGVTPAELDARDWENEDLRPNKEAAAYAEQMVSRTQNANDGSSMGNWYRAGGGWGVLSKIIMPYSTFSTNQRVRMINNLQKVRFGSKVARIEAGRDLAAQVVESGLFNAIKVYGLAALTTAGAQQIAAQFGLFSDEDKEKADAYDNKFKKFAANTVSDIFFSGAGGTVQSKLQKGTNALIDFSADKPVDFFNVYDPSKYGATDYSGYGMFGSVAQTFDNVVAYGDKSITGETTRVLPGKHTEIDEAGKEHKVQNTDAADLSPQERMLYTYLFVANGLSLAGVSDAQVSAMNQKLSNILKKQIDYKYGGTRLIPVTEKGKGHYKN